jgi:hypothetical protein
VLRMKEFGGVRQTGLNVFLVEVRIVVESLLESPASGEEFHDELNCTPRALQDRLSGEDLGADINSFLPARSLKISIAGSIVARAGGNGS